MFKERTIKMKYKITQKETRQKFATVFKVKYCEIQSIEYFLSPEAYNYGVNGWNYDLFAFGPYAICTGYRPIGVDVDEHFIKVINDIVNDCRRKHEYYNKDFNECQYECKKRIYNFLSQYSEFQL